MPSYIQQLAKGVISTGQRDCCLVVGQLADSALAVAEIVQPGIVLVLPQTKAAVEKNSCRFSQLV
jgi:hypothetical protein